MFTKSLQKEMEKSKGICRRQPYLLGPNTTENIHNMKYDNNNNSNDNNIDMKWNGIGDPYKKDTPHCNLSAMSNQFHINRKKKTLSCLVKREDTVHLGLVTVAALVHAYFSPSGSSS